MCPWASHDDFSCWGALAPGEQASGVAVPRLQGTGFIVVESVSCSVLSVSLRPYRLQPGRLLCPWDSPGKNIGVDCHFLLQGIFPTRDRTQVSCIARSFFPVWVPREAPELWCTDSAAPRYVGSSWTRDWTGVSCIGREILYHSATREALEEDFNMCIQTYQPSFSDLYQAVYMILVNLKHQMKLAQRKHPRGDLKEQTLNFWHKAGTFAGRFHQQSQ